MSLADLSFNTPKGGRPSDTSCRKCCWDDRPETCFNTPKGGRPSDTELSLTGRRALRKRFNTPKGGSPSDTWIPNLVSKLTTLVSIPRRVEGLPILKLAGFFKLRLVISFQYPEGWKAFRYPLIILVLYLTEGRFNTPKGGRPSDT